MREPDRIIRLKTVLARTGLSRSTIYRKIAEGTFPAQLKISANGTGWHESEINRWIADPALWCPKRGLDVSATRDARTAARSDAIRILVECLTTPRRSRCANSVGTRRAKCQVPFRLVKKSGMRASVLDVSLDEMLDEISGQNTDSDCYFNK